MKAGASSAATSAQVVAEKTKLQTEITLLNNKVKSAKKDMGLQIYDAMAAGDNSEVARVFGTFKAQVDSLNAQILEKRTRIEQLDADHR